MNRREALRTLAAGSAAGALAAGGVVAVTPASPTIEAMFREWYAIHSSDSAGETEDEAEAGYVRYCDLQDRIVSAEPVTARDMAMQAYADNGGSDSDHSEEFVRRVEALALQGMGGAA